MIEKNKGGRPRKEADRVQNKRVSVNFTTAEYERAIQTANRAKMPLSALLRKKALEEVVREPNFLNEEFMRFLASIASNTNQIAYACNSGRVHDSSALAANLDKIGEMLLMIRDEIREKESP